VREHVRRVRDHAAGERPGESGLMRFLELELDRALALDPQAQGSAGLGLVRPIAGDPVTMGEMTRHVPDAGSYAPVTILIQELPAGGTRLAYDSVASDIAIYDDRAATEVAENLDPVASSVWLVAPPGALNLYAYAAMRRSLRVGVEPGEALFARFPFRCLPRSAGELHPRLDAHLGEDVAKVAVNSVR
jgi:hypothetical protein